MTFNFFERFRKKGRIDELAVMRKNIDCQLRTFTNHLKQISTEYQVLHEDNLKIIELLKEKNHE